jgi:tetratricopeptide (TPR) repeat protein
MIKEEKARKLLALASELASQRTDIGLDKAAEVLLFLLEEGYQRPDALISAATFLLQGSHSTDYAWQEKAISLVDKAVFLETENIPLLERAIQCYELVLNTFPDKMNDIIRVCLRILDLDPDHVESMITLAYHREHPYVALDLEDTIRMLEWAKEVDPDNSYIDITLARLYSEAGHIGKARELLKQAMDSMETDSPYQNGIRYPQKSRPHKSGFGQTRKFGAN